MNQFQQEKLIQEIIIKRQDNTLKRIKKMIDSYFKLTYQQKLESDIFDDVVVAVIKCDDLDMVDLRSITKEEE